MLNPQLISAIAQDLNIEEYKLLYILKEEIEIYHKKPVLFTENLEIRFNDTNKKVTLSQKLEKQIVKRLDKEQEVLKKANSSKVKTLVKARIIKKGRNGYYAVSTEDEECFVNANSNVEIGESYIFYCYGIKKNILRLKINELAIERKINNLLKREDILIEKYIPNKLIIMYYTNELKKSDISLLSKTYKKEKLIYNKRG